jgi:tetrahydromethanopterin S-methyltransferase subunit B
LRRTEIRLVKGIVLGALLMALMAFIVLYVRQLYYIHLKDS